MPRIPGSPPKSVPGAPNRVPGYQLGPSTRSVMSGQGAMTRVPVTMGSKPYEKAHRQQLRDTSSRFAGGFGVAWQGLTHLNAALLQLEEDTDEALVAAGHEIGQKMLEWAVKYAPWNDRKVEQRALAGDPLDGARASLQYDLTFERDGSMSVWLAHGEDIYYGIWLEVRWGGRFAILLPTLDHFRNQYPEIIASHIRAHVA